MTTRDRTGDIVDQTAPPPDRRYVDRTPRGSERIPPDELARLIDEFTAREFPERKKRKRQPEPRNTSAGDDWDRSEQ